jgi:stage IV sporulation protein B
MKKRQKGFAAGFAAVAATAAAVLGLSCYYAASLPEQFYTASDQTEWSISSQSALVVTEDAEEPLLAGVVGQTSRAAKTATVKLWGILPVKTVSLQSVQLQNVQIGGNLFGIKLYTEGVLVVDIDKITTETGRVSPGRNAGIREGDSILSANGISVSTNEELREIIASSGGEPVQLVVKRDGSLLELSLTPALSSGNIWRGGIWVRDSTAGIGTLTCFDPTTGVFAGLGHGIYDTDTGTLLSVADGEICKAVLTGIEKGEDGSPGQLQGIFTDGAPSGTLLSNTETGVYGILEQTETDDTAITVPIALKQEVQTGTAYLYCKLDEEQAQFYEIMIEKVDLAEGKETKNLIIRVTDEKLLQKTGGIVQGMSGTPILQNGKLVGAVTHVFVNDSAKGYGIFAENMLDQMQSVEDDS